MSSVLKRGVRPIWRARLAQRKRNVTMNITNSRGRTVAAGVAGLCVCLFGVVGHGQNTASGQRFGEPPVAAPRDAGVNLATKIRRAVHGRRGRRRDGQADGRRCSMRPSSRGCSSC